MAATLNPTHAFALGDTVTLVDFPEEGEFTVTQATGHNIYNGRPCYTITHADGSTIDSITQDLLSAC